MPHLEMRARDREKAEARRLLAMQKAEEACLYLCRLGAKESFIFGSLISGNFREHSDIDIAVFGLPEKYIYRVEARIEDILSGMQFDLVYMENAPAYLVERIREKGKRYVAAS
ncbi:MAG: nucleotidyltransferase domain-containing protein [Deltaproteobacteria bacterium]|jgi:predicted nucleotidyltransferase|nr:nucleotidyltransferase domain-containing protein [Deltaproteobacteria bacterium]